LLISPEFLLLRLDVLLPDFLVDIVPLIVEEEIKKKVRNI
jgi:hypothetical protein